MAIRRILNVLPDLPALRKKSRAVKVIDHRVLELLDDMKETMYAIDGAGLAAPQVGVLRRVAVVDTSEDKTELVELINPELVLQEGLQSGTEGCLSITDLHGTVERPLTVTVRFMDRNGVSNELRAEGYLARAICHEIDHLNGILFVDTACDLHKPSELENEEEHATAHPD